MLSNLSRLTELAFLELGAAALARGAVGRRKPHAAELPDQNGVPRLVAVELALALRAQQLSEAGTQRELGLCLAALTNFLK